MSDLINMIYDSDPYMMIAKMFIFTFAIEVVLGIANLVKTMGKGVR